MIFAPSPRHVERTGWLVLAGVGAGALFLIYTAISGETLIVGTLAGLGLIGIAAWRWAPWTAVAFAGFTPVNRVVVDLVLNHTGSDALTKLVQVWKEGLIAAILLRVVYDALHAEQRHHLKYLDLLVVGFIGLTAIYLLYPGTQSVDEFTRVQGFRTDASFLFAYLAGRGLQLRRRHVRWMLLALVPGTLLSSAVAFWQFISPATAINAFDALGITQVVRGRGIGTELVRAASFQFGDLALAFYQVVLVAIAAGLLTQARTVRSRALATGFLLLMIATLAITVTRSAVLAVVPMLMLAAWVGRSYGRIALAIGATAVIGVLSIGLAGFSVDEVARLADPGEASAQGHLAAADRSLAIIQQTPFGQGLGTAGTIGQRYLGQLAVTNESWFLQLGTEMGLMAALLFLVLSLVTIATCLAVYFRVHDNWLRALALGVLGGQLGLFLVGNFLHSWENTVLSMMFWLLTGIAIGADRLEASPTYLTEP